jgi:hypothetical protein
MKGRVIYLDCCVISFMLPIFIDRFLSIYLEYDAESALAYDLLVLEEVPEPEGLGEGRRTPQHQLPQALDPQPLPQQLAT